MSPTIALATLIPLSYVVGSIPFGLLVGKTQGIDVRLAGSGNIGASNVGRLLGKKFFWIVFLLDLVKGLIPSLMAGYVIHFSSMDRQTNLLWLLVAFAAIFGHMFSIFLKFKGGKGVSTSAGALLGIWPYFTLPALAGAAIWIMVFKWKRYISLASMTGAAAFPVAYILIGLSRGWPLLSDQLPLLIAAVLLAMMIAVKHRSNISRLRAGTENRAAK